MKPTCDICKKSVEGTGYWIGNMSRFRPIKPDKYKWSGMRTIIICNDCLIKYDVVELGKHGGKQCLV